MLVNDTIHRACDTTHSQAAFEVNAPCSALPKVYTGDMRACELAAFRRCDCPPHMQLLAHALFLSPFQKRLMLASRNSPNCKPDCHLSTTWQVPSTHVDTPAATCAELGCRRNTTCMPSNAKAPHARCSGRPCTYHDNLPQRPHTQPSTTQYSNPLKSTHPGDSSQTKYRLGHRQHACELHNMSAQSLSTASAQTQRHAGKELILLVRGDRFQHTPHLIPHLMVIHR